MNDPKATHPTQVWRGSLSCEFPAHVVGSLAISSSIRDMCLQLAAADTDEPDTDLGIGLRWRQGSLSLLNITMIARRTSGNSRKPGGIPLVQCLCLALYLVSVAGCATFRCNPVSEDVITARQLSLRGMDAIQRNQWEEAESLFAAAVKTNPSDERARRRYAVTLWHRGLRESAIEQMEQSLRLSGGAADRLVQTGEMYYRQGDLDRAWQHTELAIRAQGELPIAWALRGDILCQQQRLDEAMSSYHRALSYQPHFPHVQLSLADIYQQGGRARRSLATLDSLIEQIGIEETSAEVLALKGKVLKSLGRFDDAIEVLALARTRGEPSADLLYELAEAQWYAGDEASAGLTIHTALAQVPYHQGCLQLRSEIQGQQQTLTAGLKR